MAAQREIQHAAGHRQLAFSTNAHILVGKENLAHLCDILALRDALGVIPHTGEIEVEGAGKTAKCGSACSTASLMCRWRRGCDGSRPHRAGRRTSHGGWGGMPALGDSALAQMRRRHAAGGHHSGSLERHCELAGKDLLAKAGTTDTGREQLYKTPRRAPRLEMEARMMIQNHRVVCPLCTVRLRRAREIEISRALLSAATIVC